MSGRTPFIPVFGGGPAGMSCALWLRNYGLRPLLIEKEHFLGGMAQRSPYPDEGLLGRPHETARENAKGFAHHIRQLAIETWMAARATRALRRPDGGFQIDVELSLSREARLLFVPAIAIATGTRFRGEEWLDSTPNAQRMAQEGRVHLGAPWAAEADANPGSHVVLVGGGDNAFDVGRMLAERGVQVTIVMRSPTPRALPLMLERLRKHESSGVAQVLPERTVEGLDDTGTRIRLTLNRGEHIEADHVVLLFGYSPNTDERWMAPLALERDEAGYISVNNNMETSCPGVFAFGDVANPLHPCIATALGTGTMAARAIARRLCGNGAFRST